VIGGRFAPHLLPFLALVCAPVAAVFVYLAATGRLPAGTAAAGFAVTAGGLALVVIWVLRSLDDVAHELEGDADGRARPRFRFPPAATLAALVTGRRRERDREARRVAADLYVVDTVMAALPAPLIVLDRERTVVSANAAAARLLGRDSVGRDLAAALRHPDLLEAVDRVVAGADGADVEFVVGSPTERWLSAAVRPLAERPDSTAAALILMQDLTRAKRADQMRADFVANVSHELRTPLSSLIGFIETLRGPAIDDADARSRFLEIMQDQAERMSRLVEDLMSLSRIEMDEHTEPEAEVALVPMLQQLVEAMQLKAGSRGMRFEIDAPVDQRPFRVTGDPDQLAQVFQNLIDNAVKYGREGSAVRITVRRTATVEGVVVVDAVRGAEAEDWISVGITDQGEGIEEDHIVRLTERFYRADTARSRRMGGTGLGLAIVKHVLNRHRGRLIIDSVVGRGSTFTVTLPALPALAQALDRAAGDGNVQATVAKAQH
jgi:two-component system phosphate regulon sensor histidine kinase PhoR